MKETTSSPRPSPPKEEREMRSALPVALSSRLHGSGAEPNVPQLHVDIAKLMAVACAAQSRWALTPVRDRLRRVRKLRRLITEHGSELAAASAAARHRPTLESLTAEVLPLAEACRFLERRAEKLLAPRRLGVSGRPLWLTGVRSEIRREPFGVVLLIGPGNYPLLLPGVQLLQALVAGNAVLLKPGVGGTAAARALCSLLGRAGLDPELVVLLPESTEAARAAILAHPDKVLFTGSAATGQNLLAQLAPHLIPATMELSGSDAVIIRADADVALAARAVQFGLALNAGATCMAPKRVFVAASRSTEFEGRLAQLLGSSPGNNQPGARSCKGLGALVEDALARGAHLVAGQVDGQGTVQAPVVLAGVSPSSHLLHEDIFGPVLAIITVADDQEAVARANDCPYGLAASIFSGDESAARELARRLHCGVVTINDLIVPTADARLPFGGRRRSGFGVTRGADGLLDLTAPKAVTLTRGRFRPAFEPPRSGDEDIFSNYLKLAHGGGLSARCAALWGLIQGVFHRQPSHRQRKI